MADKDELLREAVCNGNIHSVKNLIQSGVSINSQNIVNGWTALHWAVKRGHVELVEYLMQNGANPSIKTSKGETPGNLTTNETILKLLPTHTGAHNTIDTTTCSLTANDDLSFVPNYLKNPTFPYAADMKEDQPATNSINLTSNQLSDLKISNFLVKVRIADSEETDFVEVDVHGHSYHDLLRSCCEELEVPLEEVSKLRKLPNVLIRKDRDVSRLDNGQELELVLKGNFS